MNSRLPSADELNVFDSLDERHAVEVFLGKDLDQAEALFRSNFLHYQDDLLFMGPRAFAFYALAALRYLRNSESSGDADAASTFCFLVEHRLEHEPASIAPVAPILRDVFAEMLGDFARFGCDEAIYGDLAGRYRTLLAPLGP